MVKNKLGDFVKIKTGKLDANASSLSGEYPFFTCSKNPLKISSYSYDTKCVLVAGNGDLNVKYYEGKFDAYQRTYIIESKDESVLDTRYLYWFLFKYIEKLRELSIGGVIKYIKINNLTEPLIAVPSLEDQKRIVKILDGADMICQKRGESFTLLDSFLKATFLEMFGDPKVNPKKFELIELQKLYINPKNGTKCGPFGSALKKGEYVSEGVPVWNMDNISSSGQMVMPFRMWIAPEKYKSLESYSVLNGDVIISRAGTVGKMCVVNTVNEKSIISTNLIRVRFGNKLLPIYFVSLMNYCKGRVGRLKTGADGTFTHMNTGVLDTIVFPYPPIDKQNEFAVIANKTEKLKQIMKEQLKELETQFQSLLQNAFNGEL